MSALLIEGFDHYISAAELTQGGFTSAGTPTFATGRFGRGRLVELPSATEDLTYAVAATTEFFFGASIMLGQVNGVADTLVSFVDTATEQLSIRVDPSGRLYVSRNGTTLGVATGDNAVLRGNAVNYIEFTAVINDTTGSWDLIVNGQSVSSGSTSDTKETANATFDSLVLHGSANLLPSFDCLYLNDNGGAAPYNTNLGDHELIPRRPNGDGFQNDWVATGAGTTNSDRVDDTPGNDGDTTYVAGSAVNDIDSWSYENISAVIAAGADNILSVQYKTSAKGSAGTFRERIRSVAADELAASNSFVATYTYARYQSLTDPNTAAAWTSTAWDAAEAGIELLTT